IYVEAARVVAARPFFCDKGEQSVRADGKPGDGVMQAVGGIEKSCIRRNENFRSKIRAFEFVWQRGDGLLRRQLPGCGVIVEGDQRGGFFLKGVKPAAVRMKCEVPGTVAGRQRHTRLRGG